MTKKLGVEIIKEKIDRETYYYAEDREYEFAEVKLLIDVNWNKKNKYIKERRFEQRCL